MHPNKQGKKYIKMEKVSKLKNVQATGDLTEEGIKAVGRSRGNIYLYIKPKRYYKNYPRGKAICR